jgi:hypothetical protein
VTDIRDMMDGMGWSMEALHWLGVAVLLLAIVALVKYVFFR